MPQISTSVTPSTLDYITDTAKKERRSVSEVAAYLLEQAIKERERQREKNRKK
jgi:hypothetical protein